MTPTAERIVIAAFVAVVLAAVVLTGAQTFQAEQPRTPPPTPLTPVPTFAGYPVRAEPRRGTAIVCYYQPLDTWRPLQYEPIRGEVWVLIEVEGGACYGWIIDPES